MTEPHTLVHTIARWAESYPGQPALHERVDGRWRTLSWSEYHAALSDVGRGLIALGHEPGECVALVGRNSPAWVICEFGIQAARGVPAPIYVTNTPEQLAYIVKNSRAKIAIADGAEQLEKYLAAEAEELFPRLEHLVTFDEVEHADPRVISLQALRKLGAEQPPEALKRRMDELTDDETCLLIYTSGTTGVPKGVMLDHAGQLMVGRACLARFPRFQSRTTEYHAVSYLPLCHQAEQLITNVNSIVTRGQVYFCADLAELKEHLVAARPTIFLGVPRVWEKFEAALSGKLAEAKGVTGKLAAWARETEFAGFKQDVERGSIRIGLGRKLARALVVDKIKTALGLDRLEVAVTGAAPIAVSTQEFFASIGITIFEAYGMSETSGVATLTDPAKPRFGTVGTALDGVEIRIADDGEVCLRGRNMTRGYLHMEDETKELYGEDGWILTGDLGSLDAEGNLSITGRKKELLITAGGKNVAPVEMENHVKGIDGVAQCVVVGDRKPYLCALITLDPENLEAVREATGASGDIEQLAASGKVRAWLQNEIETRCNAQVARYQTIKKFELLPVEFSVEGDELTPTMKLKRGPIHEKYADVIAKLYEDAAPAKPQPTL
ncbi:MAG: long-chain fatty acid--CoA ligase [Deltaproteobacteria bacterium]|nr:long-chain fatty acid--CoA ligase [Deltaproteobacteria bacterium]